MLGRGSHERAPAAQLADIKTVSWAADTAGGGMAAPLQQQQQQQQQQPKKVAWQKTVTRKWLAVTPQAEVQQLELAKLRVTHTLGVQLRDLRLLDPQLAASYPSAILARERAIVINLEFIKAIIAQDAVFLTNLEDQNTIAFVEELQRRLAAPPGAGASGVFGSQLWQAQPSSASLGAGSEAQSSSAALAAAAATAQAAAAAPGAQLGQAAGMGGPEDLPFELRVLEAALDTVARYIEQMASDLELAAHPALDALTSKITTSNLERVRRIKNRMVRLTTRVETLREVLEKFLDDDSDMKDLNLTAKEEDRAQQVERRAGQALSFDAPLSGYMQESLPVTPRRTSVPWADGGLPADGSVPVSPRQAGMLGGTISSASSDSTDLEDDPDVAVVEMLMEPYFMQIDNTYNKLQTLCEYIDDTEDYINIELDSHRNALIRLDLVLTSFTASVALITAITGLFAMNIMLQPDKEGQAPYSWFLAVSISTGVGAICVFAGVMAYCRWQRLI